MSRQLKMCLLLSVHAILYPQSALATPRAKVLGCQTLNNCSGHGKCHYALGECDCENGYGSSYDVELIGFLIPSRDCSNRVCSFGKAWADIPESTEKAHLKAECSNAGSCDRNTGICNCYPGFRGLACEYKNCPGGGNCSGHGKCASLLQMSRAPDALPLSTSGDYVGELSTKTWDQDRIFGCICDSTWPVGLGAGERQEPEWFSPDCSMSEF
mmetsp:Transcript_31891/g.95483  ORF Transcript_31891/g.95483 Transcript_31891/m.95483 type:complete len:213 (-) Transcript_31891:437-1075(-)